MHKLNRSPAPGCLANYRHGHNKWSDLCDMDRAEIWLALVAMQGNRCAYCEADITQTPRHIEHFVQKGRQPRVTFLWDNLFGSCNREDTCGKHKDHKAGPYNDADLLKPDVDDPDEYLVFVHNGTIKPRQGLNNAQRQRAEETLRVFNLDADHGALRQMRSIATAGYLQTAETIWSLAEELTGSEWEQLLEDELTAISDLPFSTAIRHTICRIN